MYPIGSAATPPPPPDPDAAPSVLRSSPPPAPSPPANPCHRDHHVTLPCWTGALKTASAFARPPIRSASRSRSVSAGSTAAAIAFAVRSWVSFVLADLHVDRRRAVASTRWMRYDVVPEPATIIVAPILDRKDHAEPSAFTPKSLLRESRRQKGLEATRVPQVCVLDPDGDIVRHLVAAGRAHRDPDWACYHTDLQIVDGDVSYGIIGGAVGASFAVLVAEELFASGCTLLLSVTSAGSDSQATRNRPTSSSSSGPCAMRAVPSYHYTAPSRFAAADPMLLERLEAALADIGQPIQRGSTWTTDAPFRDSLDDRGAAGRGHPGGRDGGGRALFACDRTRLRGCLLRPCHKSDRVRPTWTSRKAWRTGRPMRSR